MKTELRTVKLAQLIEDFDIYPRADVDGVHIAHIEEALEAGCKMPPIIVESKSYRIIDGFHRYRAYRRVFGDDADIEVEVRTYSSEADMLLDAIRLNSSHGRNMCPSDRTHAILLAGKWHADDKAVAHALNITVERVETIKRTLTIRVEGKRARVPMKFPIRHMKGQELTEAQAKVNERLGGNQPLFWVNQLLMLIQNDMLDLTNERLIERLGELADAIRGMKIAV